jgi:arylsulfatase A-like enzyme
MRNPAKKRTTFISWLLASMAILTFSSAVAAEKPNIIVILVDDMGWMDLSCQGSDYYRTPAIDRMAAEGIRFTAAYAACAVCSPTRAAVQTGRYPHRIGLTDYIRSRLNQGPRRPLKANPTEYAGGRHNKLLCPPNPFWMEHGEITIAEALESAGYHSGYVGKWQLGDPGWYPENQGYDVNRGGCFYGQPPNYFDPYNSPNSEHESLREGIHGLPGRKPGEYLTHREADEATALIRGWHARQQPFFLQLSHYAVHTPIQAIDAVAAKYQREGKNALNAKYAAMVESVDDSTRQIMETLKELGIDKNTLIIFTSDNGGLDDDGRPTENAPLRSGKGFPYEGGIRVPFLVRWPGVIPPGMLSKTPVCSIDIFPTILEAAGVPLPKDRAIDGLSLLSHSKSGGKTKIERDQLLWHFPHYRYGSPPYSIIRQGDWKLIKFWEGSSELYNLATDLGEQKNLATENPEKAMELEALLMKRLSADQARLPRNNPDYVPKESAKTPGE